MVSSTRLNLFLYTAIRLFHIARFSSADSCSIRYVYCLPIVFFHYVCLLPGNCLVLLGIFIDCLLSCVFVDGICPLTDLLIMWAILRAPSCSSQSSPLPAESVLPIYRHKITRLFAVNTNQAKHRCVYSLQTHADAKFVFIFVRMTSRCCLVACIGTSNECNWNATSNLCRNVRSRRLQVLEALMVAMTSAMCAYILILVDTNCQDREKDKNEHPLEVWLSNVPGHVDGVLTNQMLRTYIYAWTFILHALITTRRTATFTWLTWLHAVTMLQHDMPARPRISCLHCTLSDV